jgi:microcystin-dependent protein
MDNPFIGSIAMFGFDYAPKGWLKCDGSIQQISAHMNLYNVIGTTYGGDGMETFGLPDLRSRTPVGTGQAPGFSNYVLGQPSGVEQVGLTLNNLPSHGHVPHVKMFASSSNDSAEPADKYFGKADTAIGNYYATDTDTFMVMNRGTTDVQGQSQPFNIRNPFLAICCCICTEGMFPHREKEEG